MRLPLLLLLAAPAVAQVALEGDVVRKGTAEPLTTVRISAVCGSQTFFTAADAAGHFRFPEVSAPNCWLTFDGPGILARLQRVAVRPEAGPVFLRIPLTPQSAITGKVVDENGWPIARAWISILRAGASISRRVPSRAQTDDLGRYRIGQLPPGRYLVRVRPMETGSLVGYMPAWYPGVASERDARAIDLPEGHEAAGVDFHLVPGRGAEIRGRVVPPAGFQPGETFLSVSYLDVDVMSVGSATRVAPDGTFTLRHLPARSYTLVATTNSFTASNAPPPNSARRTIQLGTDNIDDVVLNVTPTPRYDLHGSVVFDQGAKPGRVQITLTGRPNNTRFQADPAPDGSFVISGIWPGTYFATASAASGPITSIRFGAAEVLNRTFEFDGAEAPLLVTVAPETKLSGMVLDAAGHPVAGAAIIFLPSGAAYPPPPTELPRLDPTTDQTGAFTVVHLLPPGLYRVYVVEDPAELDFLMSDPDFRARQEQAFPPIRLNPGDNPPLELKMPAAAR